MRRRIPALSVAANEPRTTRSNSVLNHNSKGLGAKELKDTIILDGQSAGNVGDVVHNA